MIKLRLNCTKDSLGFFRVESYVSYNGLSSNYKPWPPFLVDTGSLESYLTTRASNVVGEKSVPLKGLPFSETEQERTTFINQYPVDKDDISVDGNSLKRRRAASAKLTFLEKSLPIAVIALPQIFLSALQSNVLGLDAIELLGEFHVSAKEAYFDLLDSAH